MCITTKMTDVTGKVSQKFGGMVVRKKTAPFRHSKLLCIAIAVIGLPFSQASFYRFVYKNGLLQYWLSNKSVFISSLETWKMKCFVTLLTDFEMVEGLQKFRL